MAGGKKVVAVRLDDKTRGITEVKLDDGEVVSIGTAIAMCNIGELDSVYHVGSGRHGEFLATDRDETKGDEKHVNLKDLPKF